jgi:hypothetical protein
VAAFSIYTEILQFNNHFMKLKSKAHMHLAAYEKYLIYHLLRLHLDWYSDGLRDWTAGVRFQAGARSFLFSTVSRSGLGLTQPHIQ